MVLLNKIILDVFEINYSFHLNLLAEKVYK